MGGVAQILCQITSWTTQQSWGNDMNALNRFWVREGRIVKFCRNLWCLKLFASAKKMENWESPRIKLDQRNCYGNWHNRLFDLLMEVCIRALSRCNKPEASLKKNCLSLMMEDKNTKWKLVDQNIQISNPRFWLTKRSITKNALSV